MGEPDVADVRVLKRSAQIMGLLILMRDARIEAEERVRGELPMELMSSAPPHPAQRDRAFADGVDVGQLDVLVVAERPARPVSDVARQMKPLASEWSGLAGDHLGRATMLLRADDTDQVARTLHRARRRTLGVLILVIADRIVDHKRARSFSLAQRCLKVCVLWGRAPGARAHSNSGNRHSPSTPTVRMTLPGSSPTASAGCWTTTGDGPATWWPRRPRTWPTSGTSAEQLARSRFTGTPC